MAFALPKRFARKVIKRFKKKELPVVSWSVRRIATIAKLNFAQTYLEIGVNKGETFSNVDIRFKDAVDPKFLFDSTAAQSEDIRFFEQTSDAFWTGGRARSYDVIFLDGLHTFEQTFRDFLASMQHAHRKTVWLIDDTLPLDVFSAIPDQEECYSERKKAGLSGFEWHGDVFKIVPTLHDFFPNLNYATLIGSGNPQTLVWFQPRVSFAARFNNLESISRLTYFDISKLESVFHLKSEAAAFADLHAAFANTN